MRFTISTSLASRSLTAKRNEIVEVTNDGNGMFFSFPTKIDTTISSSESVGKVATISRVRLMIVSIQPPKKPASRPSTIPMIEEISVEKTAVPSETREAKSRRVA